jgi:4-hydroxy-L-threonine phosphate dehydrogenase PdxA
VGSQRRTVLALTQGDPAGIGRELLLCLVASPEARTWSPLLLAEPVDHGTAFDRAGRGVAEVAPLRAVVATTLGLLATLEWSGASVEASGVRS